jgi:hypothetical protein
VTPTEHTLRVSGRKRRSSLESRVVCYIVGWKSPSRNAHDVVLGLGGVLDHTSSTPEIHLTDVVPTSL